MKTSLVKAKWFVTMAAVAGCALSGASPVMAHGGGGGGGGMGHMGSSGASHNFSSMARTSSNLGSKNLTLSKLNSTPKTSQAVQFAGANTSLINKGSLQSSPSSIVKNGSVKATIIGSTNNSITNINQPFKANGGSTGGAGGTSTSGPTSAISRFQTGPIKAVGGLAGGNGGIGTSGVGGAISKFPAKPITAIGGLAGGNGGSGTSGAGGAISRFPSHPITAIGGLAGGNGGTGNGGSGTGGTGGSGTGGTGSGGMGSGKCHPYGGWGFWPLFASLGAFGGYGGYGGGYSGGSYGGTTMVADSSPATAPTVAAATPAATVAGVDLQLIDVRLLDNGDAAKQIGPRYRVSFRNAGTSPVDHAFNVALIAADDANLTTNLPTIESRISSVATSDVTSVDLRLPATAFDMGSDAHSEFAKLFVFVDSHGEVNDVNRDNNATGVDRTAVQPAT